MSAKKGNKYALGNNGGRPPMWDNIEELEESIKDYFDSCKPIVEDGNIIDFGTPTITGLALALGFASRQSIYDYKEKEEFAYTIKKALLRVENGYEKRLSHNGATGAIFALKNMGWKDKVENETVNVNYTAEVTKEEAKEISDALEDEC